MLTFTFTLHSGIVVLAKKLPVTGELSPFRFANRKQAYAKVMALKAAGIDASVYHPPFARPFYVRIPDALGAHVCRDVPPMVDNPADHFLHAFSTFLGMPPDSDTPPACGATLTSSYNGRGKPECPQCAALIRKQKG